MLHPYRKKSLDRARECKEEGNELFRECKYREAIEKYAEALLWCPKKETEYCATFHNNKAMAHIKNGEMDDAIYETTEVLKIEPANLKALLRRSMAYENAKRYDDAIADWNSIASLHPNTHADQASHSIRRLEKIREESVEEMKTEVLCT
uniref:Tetratricopeptide repeat protein 1 n=1 Tax=Lygus hesperus TaxID=30085 RepID=A0A146L4K5_LYGHE